MSRKSRWRKATDRFWAPRSLARRQTRLRRRIAHAMLQPGRGMGMGAHTLIHRGGKP